MAKYISWLYAVSAFLAAFIAIAFSIYFTYTIYNEKLMSGLNSDEIKDVTNVTNVTNITN